MTTATYDETGGQHAAGPRYVVPAAARRRRRVVPVLAAVLAAVAVLTALLGAVWWRSEGGRWYAVETPSMGTALPVGTLVLTERVALADVEVGDVVTFHASRSGTVYTHRVVATSPRGLTTQGDVNDTPDPGLTDQAHLVGRVATHVPALGWVLRAAPVVVVGSATAWLLSLLLAPRRRRGVRLVGLSASVALANWLLHPWVGLQRISQRTADDGRGLLLDVMSVGLLPVRAEQVGGGASIALRDGQLSTMQLAHRRNGAYDVVAVLDLAWWGWALVALVCLVPMAVSLLLGPTSPAAEAPS